LLHGRRFSPPPVRILGGMMAEPLVKCAYDKLVPTVELRPNPKNYRQHPKKQIQLIGDIIAKTGWRRPVTVSTLSGLIVKGHGAHAAAVAMRYWGFFNLETHNELEGETNEPNDYEEIYRERRYDLCEAEPSSIMRSAGISRRSLIEALRDLQRHFLAESVHPKLWKVFLRPKRMYSSQFLNGQVARKNIS